MRAVLIKDLFTSDADRFDKFSLNLKDILFDCSKNIITEQTITLLLQLANECGLADAIQAMFSGEKINGTEKRAVLHTALRNFSGRPVLNGGKDVMPDVRAVQAQMKDFCKDVHTGKWKGYTEKK